MFGLVFILIIFVFSIFFNNVRNFCLEILFLLQKFLCENIISPRLTWITCSLMSADEGFILALINISNQHFKYKGFSHIQLSCILRYSLTKLFCIYISCVRYAIMIAYMETQIIFIYFSSIIYPP